MADVYLGNQEYSGIIVNASIFGYQFAMIKDFAKVLLIFTLIGISYAVVGIQKIWRRNSKL